MMRRRVPMYNVFNTESEALIAEETDYNMYIANHSNPLAYAQGTTRWAIPSERLDGKWVYQVCNHGIQTHTQEEYSSEWFPVVDI